MCGLVAWAGVGTAPDLGPALESLHHRGPDARGEEGFAIGEREVSLGHTRLSIIDLSNAANQPLKNRAGTCTIVFNGEIYNHKALRSKLRERGVQFSTQSDTEVLLAAYEQFGTSCVDHLQGMYAFLILDLRKGWIFGARDPFGIKPLYYANDPERRGIAFASEIKALNVLFGQRSPIDQELLPEFLLNGYLYEPATGFVGVNKVPPGHTVVVDLSNHDVVTASYLDRLYVDRVTPLDEQISNELSLEVEADVPVGVFFSGGIDSTVLAALAPRSTQALFIDYSGDAVHEDRAYARDIAKALQLPYQEVNGSADQKSVEQVLSSFNDVARGTEEPISDYTFLATESLSRFAREAGFKVMLSGMGGDELFAGYPRYLAARHWTLARSSRGMIKAITPLIRNGSRWQKKIDRLHAFLAAPTFLEAYTQLVGYFSFQEVAELFGANDRLNPFREKLESLGRPVADQSYLKQAMYLDRLGFLSHNLTVTDRASMRASLEVRVPLLTHSIAITAFNNEDSALLGLYEGKKVLRKILRNRLPSSLFKRPKAGFNPPMDGLIRKVDVEEVSARLLRGRLCDVLDVDVIKPWIREHFSGGRNHTYRLWQLMYLDAWLQEHRA